MRRIVAIFLAWCGAVLPGFAGAQIDSAKLEMLDARLDAYFRRLDTEKTDVKNEECDFLIENTPEGALREHVALRIYDHYLHSPVMGDEAVAIHLTDTWFAPGKVKMGDDADLMAAKVFADFNRQSLPGMQAPALELQTPEGGVRTVGPPFERCSVLYFYDTQCATCKVETVFLRRLLESGSYSVDFYAVYTGDDAGSWKTWRETRFKLDGGNSRVIHLWDPDVSSDFVRKYGVLQTPRMFLVGKDGRIIGRGLDHDALRKLLDLLEYEYGGEQTRGLFDRLFDSYGDTLRAQDVLHTAELLRRRTLDEGDTLSFKHLEGDLLYYLSSRREEAFRSGTGPFLEEYVLSRPEIWNTPEDTLKIVGMAEMMQDLLSRTPVGSRLPDLPVEGWKKLRRRGGYAVFYTEGCAVCQAELEAAGSLRNASKGRRRPQIVTLDVDDLLAARPELAATLLDTFDLSFLPFVMKVDRRGRVERKYVSLAKELRF